MTIDLESWRGRAKIKLQQLQTYLTQAPDGLTAATYTTLCGLTLWPLAAAAVSGGGADAYMATLMLANGIGGNLLANLIQSWRDRSVKGEELSEEQFIASLGEQIQASTEEWVPKLGEILDKLDALPAAAEPLTEEMLTQLEVRLKQDVQSLGDFKLVVALGEKSIAIAERGINVGGDVTEAVINTGDNVTINYTTNHYHPESDNEKELRANYLRDIVLKKNELALRGIDPHTATGQSEKLQLNAVYTALLARDLTVNMRDAHTGKIREVLIEEVPGMERRLFPTLMYLNTTHHLVLLGAPGSGKSTFVNFVAACMAGELLHESTVNLAQLTAPLPTDDDTEPQPQPWEHGALLPVTVTLRELAAGWLPDAHHPATEKQFWQYVTAQLNQPEYAKFLRHELRTHGGLLLFDGLDEVPTAERHRDHIKQLVEDVATVFPKCRILITSRTYAYQKEDWKLAGFSEAELTPFTPSQINRFIERWYEHVAAVSQDINTETATGRATLLKQAIDRSQRLQEFAQQPLLLTLMATLHAFRGGSLPDKRVELYEEAVQLLLDRWEKQRAQTNEQGEIVQGGRSLHEWLRVDQAAVFNLLCRLAFEVHSTQTDLQRTADILERDLVMGLYNLGKEQGQAINQQEIINYISQRAGLLIAHANGVYTFPHRTFQEYLASVHLTEDEYPYKMAELVRRDPNRWREVTLLAGGKAGSGATAAVWLLVDALCAEPDTEVGEELTEMLWGALLAGQLITETIDLKKPLHRAQERHLKRTKTLLIEAMTSEEMPILERALAGRLLSQLGDPREGVGVTEEGLPDIVWGEEVPAGTYTIGGDSDASRSFDEQQITIEEPYQLSRYPITYSQFQCFVEADDYDDPRWWGGMPERGKDWLDTEHVTKEVSEQRFRFLNHPRENVTWYQAVAFCRWLSDKLDLDVTLPHEYQWEVAARYPNGQKYPWGDEFVETLANTHESSLNMTTAVGMYPQGRNEKLDLYDLSGNVWEWCINKWNVPEDSTVDESSASRVLRGGSWSGNQDYARVALRNDDGPYDRDLNFGFRVCCVCPPSRPLSTGPSGER